VSETQSTIELGARLRAAREALTIAQNELANRLKLPIAVLRHIESGDFEKLGAPVYRRGYLTAYARAVGVAQAEIAFAFTSEAEAAAVEPVAAVLMPRRSNTLDRYASAASYVVGTTIAVFTLVWSFQQARVNGARAVPISSPQLAMPAQPQPILQAPGVAPVGASAAAPASVTSYSPGPVIASLTPVFTPTPRALNSNDLILSFSEETWLEVRRLSDSKRLEYNLMAAGTTKTFPLEGGLKVVIGNVRGVSAQVSSSPFDLVAVTRGNVASFELPLKP